MLWFIGDTLNQEHFNARVAADILSNS